MINKKQFLKTENEYVLNKDDYIVRKAGIDKLSVTKKFIKDICEELSQKTTVYNPQTSIENIQKHFNENNKLKRILYSEISNHIFSLDGESRGIFNTNVLHLLEYSSKELDSVKIEKSQAKKKSKDVANFIVKIYDHAQLANSQIENSANIIRSAIDSSKNDVQNQLKEIEKDYITILGIFSTVVLTFIGGVTFSSSVLQSIHLTSIYRLLITLCFLALILINTTYMLVRFILIINTKEIKKEDGKKFNINTINLILLSMTVIVFLAWLVRIDLINNFILQHMPWKIGD